MPELVLTIGNCNYSSWSLRAWLAIERTGAPYREDQLWLDEDAERQHRLARSPVGKVPVLRHGELVVWDSLAIAEYLAELYPEAGLWPAETGARARARSLCAEMHAGFGTIRSRMPMNCRVRKPHVDRGAELDAEVARVIEIWRETRASHGTGGTFLFGEWCLADAFFAPVVSRFATYGIPLEGEAAEYAAQVLAWPAMAKWMERAAAEKHTLPDYDALD